MIRYDLLEMIDEVEMKCLNENCRRGVLEV